MKPEDSRNSGGASPPCATVTGGAWVHAPPQEKPSNRGGLDRLLPPLLFLAGGEDQRHLQPKENAQAVCFSYFFRSVSLCFPSLSASLSSFSGLFLGLRRLLLCFRYLGGGWWRSGSVCDGCGSSLLEVAGLWALLKVLAGGGVGRCC